MNIASILLALLFAVSAAPASHIERVARELLDNFNAGRFDAASKDFNNTLRAKVTPQLLDEMKKELNAETGQFRSIEDVRERRINGQRVIDMMLRYDKSLVAFRTAFDGFDGVASVYFTQIKADPVLEATSRSLLDAFVASDLDKTSKDFNATLRNQLTRDRLAELRANVAASYGAFKSVADVSQRLWNGYRVIDLTTMWEKNTITVSVTFDADGKVGGLFMAPQKK
jgi:hypothetical protein